MSPHILAAGLGFLALAVPVLLLAILGVALLVLPRGLPERRVHQLTSAALGTGLAATLAAGLLLLLGGGAPVDLDLGPVLAVRGYHLDLAFVLDGPAVLLLALDFLLCGLVARFSSRYLHQDEGYHRFYVLLLLFAAGIALVAAARGLDLLFAGWELIGLSSALLIAFFHRRAGPVRHGLRAYAVYRLTDIGLLVSVVLLHHLAGTSSMAALAALPAGSSAALLLGGLLIFGAMGKAASVPFTGWLPRAMEGPTPSSAIFYGALSIHASPFLLLRISPLLEANPALAGAVAGIGLLTALHATMAGRTQPDIKSALGYASVAQVGLIWAEIGLGLHGLALVHLGGHAILRTWQLLRAPSLLHDRHQLTGLLLDDPGRTGRHLEALLPAGLRRRAWLLSLERWYLDEALEGLISALALPLRALDRADRAWTRLLDGETPTPAALPAPGEGALPEVSNK